MMPPTVTAAFCALPPGGETVTASGSTAFGGTEDWGSGMLNTWRCDLVPDPYGATSAGQAAACVQRSGAPGPAALGVSYTVPGASGLMKPVTVTGGVGLLGQRGGGTAVGSGAAVGTGAGKKSRGGRKGVSVVGVLVAVAVGVGFARGL
jgi:hypothetical protein